MNIYKLSGQLNVTGAGPHRIRDTNAVGTTWMSLWNQSNGTAAGSQLNIGNDLSELQSTIIMTASSYTLSGTLMPNNMLIRSNGAGGLNIDAANGPMRLYSVTTGISIMNCGWLHSNGGFNGSYNGFGIVANVLRHDSGSGATRGTQANTSVPSWMVDVGGHLGGDGAPFGVDEFAIFRRPGGGSWARLLKMDNAGTVTAPKFSTGDIELDNQFVITEHDKVGIKEPGVAILNAVGDIVMFVDRKGTLYARMFEPLSKLFARRRT